MEAWEEYSRRAEQRHVRVCVGACACGRTGEQRIKMARRSNTCTETSAKPRRWGGGGAEEQRVQRPGSKRGLFIV